MASGLVPYGEVNAATAGAKQRAFQYQETLTKLRQSRIQDQSTGAKDYAARLTQFNIARQSIERQILSIMSNPGLLV